MEKLGRTVTEPTVEWPIRREELIEHLNELSDIDIQKARWARDAKDPSKLSFAVNFLFDDTELKSDPKSYIGLILRNEAEVTQISALIAALDDVFTKRGPDLPDLAYLDFPEWDRVIAAAQSARDQFMQS
jgi:hypothetical protein